MYVIELSDSRGLKIWGCRLAVLEDSDKYAENKEIRLDKSLEIVCDI
jgi:hypothetical protein